MNRYHATIEFLPAQRAAIVALFDSAGEWAGAGRIECRSGRREDLAKEGYKAMRISARAKGGELVRFSEIKPIRPRAADPENPDRPPDCTKDCKYRQTFRGFALQRNALRLETAHMINPERCGWNLLPGRIGGHPLDYAPCIYTPR